jgi:hypothetical protein
MDVLRGPSGTAKVAADEMGRVGLDALLATLPVALVEAK